MLAPVMAETNDFEERRAVAARRIRATRRKRGDRRSQEVNLPRCPCCEATASTELPLQGTEISWLTCGLCDHVWSLLKA